MKYRPSVSLLTFFVSFLLASTAFAGNLANVPYTFSSRTTASASQVNDNFEALRAQVDDNANDIAVITGQVTKRINISLHAVDLYNGIAIRSRITLGLATLPDAVNAQIDFNFRVPDDYVAGTALVLELIWHSSTNVGAVDLRRNWGRRFRVGEASSINIYNDGTDPAAIDTAANGIGYIYKTDIPIGTTNVAGDYIGYGMYRVGSDSSTGAVYLDGMSIRYTAN